jgi:hypothetical protein
VNRHSLANMFVPYSTLDGDIAQGPLDLIDI